MGRFNNLLDQLLQEKRDYFSARLRAKLGKLERGDRSKIAAACDTTLQTLKLWEGGESFPSDEHLEAIAKYFNISMEELIGEELHYYYLKSKKAQRKKKKGQAGE